MTRFARCLRMAVEAAVLTACLALLLMWLPL